MMRMVKSLGAAALFTLPLMAQATTAPDGASTQILSPMDGATVSSPVVIQFGLSGMGVAPAGTDRDNTGHHHLLINLDELPPMDQPVASDDQHRHFGGGQTQVSLDLPPGEHTLQLLFGDKDHIPHTPPVMSDKITITVE